MPAVSGVYLIKCLTTNKVYVGSSSNIRYRFWQHRSHLRKGIHHSSRLQREWQEYGENSFEFLVIEEVEVDKLFAREKYYINLYQSLKPEHGYNIALVTQTRRKTSVIKEDTSIKTASDGTINGKVITSFTTTELSIFISEKLLNQIIQVRGALGLTKSQLAQEALFSALHFLEGFNPDQPISITPLIEGESNFRGNVPEQLYSEIIELGASIGLDKRQATYLALYLFVNNPIIQARYKKFLKTRAAELHCTEDQVVEALYGLSKALSRAERLKLVESGDPKGSELKMNI